MIRLIQRRLIIPRGDTGSFSIPVLKKGGTGNIAVFTIFDVLTRTKMFQKEVAGEGDSIVIAFTHNDTVNLKPGKYVWDIKYYSDPIYADEELVNGSEIDSYYAGYTLPVCEIRETADNYLVSPDGPTSTLSPEQLDIITSAINSLNNAIEKTQENVEHYPEIRDEVWYVWDAEEGDYVSTGVRANGIVGNGIESAVLNDDYTLTLNFTDGTSFTSPNIRGETGNGIDDIVLNNDFTLTISYTDGESYTTPSIRGPVGATPQFSIGTVQDGAVAAASITGTAENPVLNLTLPNAHVPTRVSQLENDAGYLTQHQDLSDYVRNTDYATKNSAGVVKINGNNGIVMLNNELAITGANETIIKQGTDIFRPLVSNRQHASTFYGLAKAAGDTTQSQSSNAVGAYTNEAKAAIQTMLDVPSTSDIPVESGTGVGSVRTKDFTIEGTTYSNIANGMAAFAEGLATNATNFGAHAEGGYTSAFGAYSHSEGNNVIAMGNSSHAEGRGAVNAICQVSNTENDKQYLIKVNSSASVDYTPYILHTIITVDRINYGFITQVEKINNDNNEYLITVNKSIGNGYNKNNCILYFAYAMGIGSHKEGAITAAIADYQHVQGKWNVIDIEKQYADIVGNGTNVDARSNAYALTWTGDGKYAGDVYVHANADSSGGTKLATVEDIPEVPVTDVQVNGVSVLQDGVANVPIAGPGKFGAVQVSGYGLQMQSNGYISTKVASAAEVKTGLRSWEHIAPYVQHQSTFYGLAKAAGADEKDSTLPVGQYTDTAKTAIRAMIGATSSNVIAVQDTQPTDPDTKIWLPETAETPVTVPTVAEMNAALAGKLDTADAGLKVVRLI